jgi:TRAP-type C4-dicarboxylate transport system permease small subunit
VVIFFAASVLIGGGSQLVRETFRLEQQMIAIPIPKAWVYMAIPISGVFTILFSLELIVETWRGGAQAQPAKAPGDIT